MQRERRRIVSWSQEEDDILREQICIHGTENWANIAAKLKDKTSRQCRRRWYTYLNSDFKKGGWSPEEDSLLCEAQKIFGNRWTEISKLVPGRTDNAVKNRFATLSKKRAKYEALAKERNTSFINLNNKRVICNGFSTQLIPETATFSKKRRTNMFGLFESSNLGEGLAKTTNQQPGPESDVVVSQTSQNMMDLQDLLEDIRTSNEGSQPSWRKPILHEESEGSSDSNTRSGVHSTVTWDRRELGVDELCALEQEVIGEAQSTPIFGLQAAEVSSPKFSESERQFLLKAFGMEGLHSNSSMQDAEPPPCKGSSSMVLDIHTDHNT